MAQGKRGAEGELGDQNPEYLGKYPTIHPTIPYVGIWMDGWMDAIGTWQRAKGELRGSWEDQDTESWESHLSL